MVSGSRGDQAGAPEDYAGAGAGVRVIKNFYYNLSIVHSRLSSHFASEKSFGAERFALAHEIAHLSNEKPHDYGLILGVDHFGRTLQITPTKNRPNLGNVLKVAPSQGGKSTDFKNSKVAGERSAEVR